MKKDTSIAPGATYINLLAYSSWLVAGIWLIYTGIMLLYKPSGSDNTFLNHFFGVVRILVGIHALLTAHATSRDAHDPQKSSIRVITYIILLVILVLPLLLFIMQTSMMIFGTYQPDEHYSENLGRLIFIVICYIFAIIYADWRLKK